MQLLIDSILFHCHSYSMRLVHLKFFHLDFSFFNHWFIYCLCSEFLKMYAFYYIYIKILHREGKETCSLYLKSKNFKKKNASFTK